MNPIATIYQLPDGSFGIMSNVATNIGLAQILTSLLANQLEQAANASPAAVAAPSVDNDHVAEGAEKFSEETIAECRGDAPAA